MESFFKKINTLKHLRLDADAKHAIRERLIEHVDAFPVKQNNSWFESMFSRPTTFAPVFGLVLVLIIVGGGASLAAQNSLPGDALYPIKVNFTEKVGSAFQISSEAKASYEVKLAERRLDEATELVAQGRIGVEEAVLTSQFQAHAEKAQMHIRDTEKKGNIQGAAAIVSRLEGSLKAQEEILGKVEIKSLSFRSTAVNTMAADQGQSLREGIRSALNTAEKTRIDLQARVASAASGTIKENRSAQITASKNTKTASSDVSATRSYMEKKSKQKNKVNTQAVAKLQSAENLIKESRSKMREGSFGEAFTLGNEAVRTAKEAKALVQTENDLGLNLDTEIESAASANTTSEIEIKNDHADSIGTTTQKDTGGDDKDGEDGRSDLRLKIGF